MVEYRLGDQMFLRQIHYYFMHGCPHCIHAEPVIDRLQNLPAFKKMKCVLKRTESEQAPPHIHGFPTLMCKGKTYPGPLHSEHDIMKWIKKIEKQSTRRRRSTKGRNASYRRRL